MNIKQTAAAFALVAGVSGVALFGANAVSAQTSSESIADRVATRFDLDSGEVQAVFDEVREERRAERQEQFSQHLQSLVDEGTITAEQQAIIEEAKAEMQTAKEEIKPDNFRELSEEEREAVKASMEELRDSFKQTLEDAGIDPEDIKPDRGGRGGHGFRRGGHRF